VTVLLVPEVPQLAMYPPLPISSTDGAMLKLVKAGGKPQLAPFDTWPPTHSHWLPVQTAPDTLQTQALPTRVALE
jgi:hypothetical protein